MAPADHAGMKPVEFPGRCRPLRIARVSVGSGNHEGPIVSDKVDRRCGSAPAPRQSIRVAIGSILRTPPTNDPSRPGFGNRVLNGCGRSLTGLDEACVAREARRVVDVFEPLIEVRDVAVEMTPSSAVNAITIRYEIIESGDLHDIRVEIPT